MMCYVGTRPNILTAVVVDSRANLKKVMLNFHQHIMCATRGERTLDHCYTPFKRDYKAASLPPSAMSDHGSIFLLPEYKQRIVWEAVVMREVKRWSDQTEADLQDAMINVDMFQLHWEWGLMLQWRG